MFSIVGVCEEAADASSVIGSRVHEVNSSPSLHWSSDKSLTVYTWQSWLCLLMKGWLSFWVWHLGVNQTWNNRVRQTGCGLLFDESHKWFCAYYNKNLWHWWEVSITSYCTRDQGDTWSHVCSVFCLLSVTYPSVRWGGQHWNTAHLVLGCSFICSAHETCHSAQSCNSFYNMVRGTSNTLQLLCFPQHLLGFIQFSSVYSHTKKGFKYKYKYNHK